MPEAGANLWVSQADSDRLAANRLYDKADHRTFCQTIAKYQQVVEKSVKAIAAAVRDAGIVSLPQTHYYKHPVDKLISALRHHDWSEDDRGIQGRINRLLNDSCCLEVRSLSDLAPRKPSPGSLHARNTEYPYEIAAGQWTAPALLNSFSIKDVERFGQLAERIYQGTREIVSAIRLR
jgi:HEPN domain-containing protein